MPLYHVAIVGSLIGLLLTDSATAQSITNDPGPSASSTQSQPSFSDNIRRIADAIESVNTRQDSTDENDRAQRDLNAQEDMAKWAKWMFVATFFQGFVALITLYLVRSTLRETKRTADAAVDAAKAAAEQSKTAEAEFVATHRPKLHITVARVDAHTSGPVKILLIVGNVGVTRVERLQIKCAVIQGEYVPVALTFADVSPDKNGLVSGEVARANHISTLIEQPHLYADVFCIGTIAYTDQRGTVRYAGFCRKYDGETGRFVATNDPDYEYSY